jgi:peptidoglycan-associated lipoprotein
MIKSIGFAALATVILLTGCTQKGVVIGQDGMAIENSKKLGLNNGQSVNGLDQNNLTSSMADDERLKKFDSNNSNSMNSANNSDGTNGKNMSKNFSDIPGVKSIFFALDKYTIDDQNRQIIKGNSKALASFSKNIKIEGNCDEWGSDEYNFALGLKRAKAAKDALVEDGVSDTKISLVSLGESNPQCKEQNEECWKLNRRVDFIEVK